MYSALDAVRVITDPHVGVFIHFSAVGIENIIVVAYLCKALSTDTVRKIEGISAAIGKTVHYELALAVESVPASSVEQLCRDIYVLIDRKLLVSLDIVVVSVKFIEALGQLDAVYGEVELSVFADYFLLAVLEIRNKHLSVLAEIMYSALDAVRVITDPHVGVFVHSSCAGIKDIIIVAYLFKALGVIIIFKVICFAVDIGKSVCNYEAVIATPVFSGLQFAASGCCA